MTSTNLFFVMGWINWFFLPLQMILMELVFNWKSVFGLEEEDWLMVFPG